MSQELSLMDGVDFYRRKWALGRDSHVMNSRITKPQPHFSLIHALNIRVSFLKHSVIGWLKSFSDSQGPGI